MSDNLAVKSPSNKPPLEGLFGMVTKRLRLAKCGNQKKIDEFTTYRVKPDILCYTSDNMKLL